MPRPPQCLPRHLLPTLGLVAAMSLGARPAAAAPITFADADWSGWTAAAAQTGSTGFATVSRVASGGNPALALQVENRTGNSATFFGVALNPLFTYDPAAGALVSVTYAFDRDLRDHNGNGQCEGLALEQAGILYVSAPAVCEYPASWTTTSQRTLDSTQFDNFPATADPEFGLGAAPITFGLYAMNNGAGRTTISRFDNLTITLNGTTAGRPDLPPTPTPAPEPASLALVAAGIGAMAGLRRRRA